MKLLPPIGTVPTVALLSHVRLERQTLAHNEADYQAVMDSRAHLRAWSGDAWPEDDFRLEDNRADLAQHIQEAEQGFAYGYTVFDADTASAEVQGSVYLYPAEFFVGRYRLTTPQRAALTGVPVAVDYWLRPALEAGDGHAAFVHALTHWIHASWGFETAAFMSRPSMADRRALLDRLGVVSNIHAESVRTPGWWQWFQVLHCAGSTR